MILLRTLLFTLIMPCSITVWIPYFVLPSGMRGFSWGSVGWGIVGLVPIALGVAIYLWCVWDFAFAGRGTPAPWDAPRELVARGLYRFVRNPMYVGVSLVLVGEAVLFRSATLLVYAMVVGTGCHLFVLGYEEPTLRRKFGESYEAYCRAVPRWPLRMTRAPKGR